MIEGDGWKPVASHGDRLLVQRIREGDAEASGHLYERFFDRLFRVARQYLRDRDDATDAVHDTFAKVIVALREGRYEEQGKLDSYLCLACARVCLDMVTKMARRYEQNSGIGQDGDPLHLLVETGSLSHADEALDHVLDEEVRQTIYRLIEALPDKEAAVIAMAGAGVTMREMARTLTTTIPAVKARLWRARAAAEVLIQHDPRFDAIRPEDMTRRRTSRSALPGCYQHLLEGNGRAQQENVREGLHDE